VIGSASGDATAAEAELYRRFAPRVRLYGVKHLDDRTAADDLAQQVMLTVIERLRAGDVRDPDQIGSFVLGTSRMTAGGMRRTERRRGVLRERFGPREPLVSLDDTSVDADRIAPCLDAVRDRERTILLLTFYAEKSATEIAKAIGMTAGAVRVARHRALESMRQCLEKRRSA
jgi:RNA polymerase sigma-70 factor (ECF subfamily)